MKPASIVSLIIAVLLVILGLVTCIIAQNMANANGEFLFSETREDGLVTTVDLTESEVSKIELIVGDAEINIIGKSDTSKIEFVNFRENYYNLSVANRVLSFSEIPDVTSMLKFWENGFTFKGMRYIINFAKDRDETAEAKKVINLYISKDKEVKIFDIEANTCKLNINSISSDTDYQINVKNAEISLDALKTSSNIYINAEKDSVPAEALKLDIGTTIMANLDISAKQLDMTTKIFRCSGTANIVCETGNVDIKSVRAPDNLKLELTSDSGNIIVAGESVTSPYAHITNGAEDSKLTVKTKSADISVAQSSGGQD